MVSNQEAGEPDAGDEGLVVVGDRFSAWQTCYPDQWCSVKRSSVAALPRCVSAV
jgi:hypothetical protein